MRIKILNLSTNETPQYKSTGAAGFDIAVSEDTVIDGASMALVPTGIHLIIPEGYEGQLRLRSSMCKKHVVMPNAPGTIDSDYRGEIKVPLRNLAPYNPCHLLKGERIAQIVIHKCPQVILTAVSPDEFASFAPTSRGSGGFGSTGTGMTNPYL